MNRSMIGQEKLQAGISDLPTPPTIPDWYKVAGLAGTAIGAYHGYARNQSVGWAIGWALLGGLAPFIVIPVALAQGLGEREG